MLSACHVGAVKSRTDSDGIVGSRAEPGAGAGAGAGAWFGAGAAFATRSGAPGFEFTDPGAYEVVKNILRHTGTGQREGEQ